MSTTPKIPRTPECGSPCAEFEALAHTNAKLREEIERWRDSNNRLRSEMEHQSLRANTAEADNAALRAALEPFSHDDLCEQLGGNVQGENSPIFGRNRAVLVLGNFRRARAALVAHKNHGKENP